MGLGLSFEEFVADFRKLFFPNEDPALIYNEIHGLRCFEDRPGTKFVSASASVCIRTAPSRLAELVADTFSREEPFAPAVEIALELYAASHFDPSPRSRFLTLLNAIECLISRRPKAPEVVSLLNDLEGEVSASGLTKEQKDALSAALRNLRGESIRQAGRRLSVEALGEAQFAGDSAQDFFDKCYTHRSSMLHGGKGGARPKDIAPLIGELDRFVVELIKAAMRA